MKPKQESITSQIGKKKLLLMALAACLVIAVAIISIFLSMPQRSVAAYCNAHKIENDKLAASNGTSYGVKVFSHRSSNPADFVEAFGNLERVAPDEIRADVKTLHQVFKKINDDPSQAIGASLSGVSAEKSVTDWTNKSCK